MEEARTEGAADVHSPRQEQVWCARGTTGRPLGVGVQEFGGER